MSTANKDSRLIREELIEHAFREGGESVLKRAVEYFEALKIKHASALTASAPLISYDGVIEVLNSMLRVLPRSIEFAHVLRRLGYTPQDVNDMSDEKFKAILATKGVSLDDL